MPFFIERDRVTKTPQMKGETKQSKAIFKAQGCMQHTLLENGFLVKLQKIKLTAKFECLKIVRNDVKGDHANQRDDDGNLNAGEK